MQRHTLSGIRTVLLLALLAATLTLSACGGQSSPAQPAAAEVGAAAVVEKLDLPLNIDAQTVNELRGREDVLVLDVREDFEFAAGHIPGATLIPLGQLSSRLADLPADKTILAVCRSGNRSGQATELLKQKGFDVHNMQGGMIAWENAGFEIDQ